MTEAETAAVDLYLRARERVCAAGFRAEIEWQKTRSPWDFRESDFLRETAWVILCSGFRERTIRGRFSQISLCFCDWASGEEIARRADVCRRTALDCLAHAGKIDAILSAAFIVAVSGFDGVRARILENPIRALQRFDHIGAITAYHLAKNLGFQVVKPDRHLVRLSQRLGFCDASSLCHAISSATGDSLSAVDIVLWRYCTLAETRHGTTSERVVAV